MPPMRRATLSKLDRKPRSPPASMKYQRSSVKSSWIPGSLPPRSDARQLPSEIERRGGSGKNRANGRIGCRASRPRFPSHPGALMRRFAPAVFVAMICAVFAFVPPTPKADAQQVASQFPCTALLDGGSPNAICGTIPTNYQPFTATCEVSVLAGDKSSAAATVNFLGSGNGTNYGTIADAG